MARKTWARSKEPQFIDKVRDLGPFLKPPVRAVVLCVDENPQIQALDRTAPIFPMLPGTSSGSPMTHKTPAIQRWLAAQPRFVLYFTPTPSSMGEPR